MRKEVVYGLFGILVILGILFLIEFGPSITSASVSGQPKCVDPQTALNLVKENNCTEMETNLECKARGLVEIRCP